MAFDDRAALELEIDACSTRVRDLQEQVRSKNGDASYADVAAEVKRLVGLRKQLQSWSEPEDAEDWEESVGNNNEEEDGVGDNNDENNDVAVNRSPAQDKKQEVAKAPKAPVADKDEEAQSRAALERRVGRVADWLATADAQLQELRDGATKLSRTKRALVYLSSHAPPKPARQQVVEKPVVTAVEADSKPKESKAGKSKSKAKTKAAAVQTEPKAAVEPAATKSKSETENNSKLNALAVEQAVSAAVAPLQAALAKEQAAASELANANEVLRASESALQDAQVKLEQTLSELQDKNRELLAKAEAAAKSDNALQTQVKELQRVVKEFEDEKDAKETHLGKLWRTVDEMQVANKKLTDKNTELEADNRSCRILADEATAKCKSNDERTESMAEELEAAKEQVKAALAETAALREVLDQLKTNHEELEAKLSAAESASSGADVEVLSLKEALAIATGKLDTAATEREALVAEGVIERREKDKETEALRERVAELEAMEGSWRVELDQLAAKLSAATAEAKTAATGKDASAALVRKLQDEVVSLKLQTSQADKLVAAESSQVATLRTQLEHLQAELAASASKGDVVDTQRAEMEAQLQQARSLAASKEELLQKARASLLLANEELKEARAHHLKWKNSAQTATVQVNEKAAEADSARKQANRARIELTSANAARKQLTDSLKDREKKVSKLTNDLAVLRQQLAAAHEQNAAAEMLARTAVAREVTQLKETSSLAVSAANAKLATYQQLVYGLVPLLAAVLLYAISS